MTHVLTYERDAADYGGAGWLGRWRKAIADWRSYRQTYEELEALSDRELADLGLSRHSIRDVAREAAYGA
jgi:uncharacterized protein YjiS (DUF1127 family)